MMEVGKEKGGLHECISRATASRSCRVDRRNEQGRVALDESARKTDLW